ncbi:uncharacterized protein RHO17_020968 isoform 10-T12 [Thomomys bottae]
MRASANGVRRHAPLTTVSQWCPETRPLAGNIRVPAPGWRGQPSQSVYVLKHIRLLHHKKQTFLWAQESSVEGRGVSISSGALKSTTDLLSNKSGGKSFIFLESKIK